MPTMQCLGKSLPWSLAQVLAQNYDACSKYWPYLEYDGDNEDPELNNKNQTVGMTRQLKVSVCV